jgi:hypothetical protein
LGSYQPKPNPALAVEKFLLEHVNGVATQGELAAQLKVQFPRRFGSVEDALAFVAKVTERYGL